MAAFPLNYESPRSSSHNPRTIRLTPLLTLIAVLLGLVLISRAIVPTLVSGRAGDAKLTAAKMDVATLRGALAEFQSDVGRLPTEKEGLSALLTAPEDCRDTWHGPYVRRMQYDPWGHRYVYRNPGTTGAAFDLLSYGPDGKPGGGDDISQ